MLLALILLFTFISGYFLPWWAACIFAFAAALFLGRHSRQAFWSGFAGLGLAWLAMAMLKSLPNNNVLATRVAHLFQLPHWLLILTVTVLIGGLVGGMSALSGFLMKRMFEKDNVA